MKDRFYLDTEFLVFWFIAFAMMALTRSFFFGLFAALVLFFIGYAILHLVRRFQN